MAQVIKILGMLAVSASIGCSDDLSKNKKEGKCIIKKINLYGKVDSINVEASDTLSFSLQQLFDFDSVFIHTPYTSVLRLEKKYGCKFDEFNYIDDDTWCLLVFKRDGHYFYSVLERKYDFVGLTGSYSSSIPLLIGIKEVNRYKLRFLKE